MSPSYFRRGWVHAFDVGTTFGEAVARFSNPRTMAVPTLMSWRALMLWRASVNVHDRN